MNWVISAYNYLSPLRIEHLGMGGSLKGPIPLSEIIAYSLAFPIFLNLEEFCLIIRNLDVKFLERWEAKEKIRQNAEKQKRRYKNQSRRRR